jgi:hypothetical protein
MAKLKQNQFRFRKHDSIGAAAAEDDKTFLSTCFYDTGDLECLRTPGDPRRILVGRTGIGKTALLLRLTEVEEHVVWLEPGYLALQYLSNSTILKELNEIGVNLDPFYKLLWTHILIVELIRLRTYP